MIGGVAQAQHYVEPHVTRNGTSVQGHYQTDPSGRRMDNYSTQGSINPYTGQVGTRSPYQTNIFQPSQPTYPHQRQTYCTTNYMEADDMPPMLWPLSEARSRSRHMPNPGIRS